MNRYDIHFYQSNHQQFAILDTKTDELAADRASAISKKPRGHDRRRACAACCARSPSCTHARAIQSRGDAPQGSPAPAQRAVLDGHGSLRPRHFQPHCLRLAHLPAGRHPRQSLFRDPRHGDRSDCRILRRRIRWHHHALHGYDLRISCDAAGDFHYWPDRQAQPDLGHDRDRHRLDSHVCPPDSRFSALCRASCPISKPPG